MEDDPFLFTTDDRELAERLMRERRTQYEGRWHLVTSVQLMAETPGREGPMWAVRGHAESDSD